MIDPNKPERRFTMEEIRLEQRTMEAHIMDAITAFELYTRARVTHVDTHMEQIVCKPRQITRISTTIE